MGLKLAKILKKLDEKSMGTCILEKLKVSRGKFRETNLANIGPSTP